MPTFLVRLFSLQKFSAIKRHQVPGQPLNAAAPVGMAFWFSAHHCAPSSVVDFPLRLLVLLACWGWPPSCRAPGSANTWLQFR